MIGGKSKEKNIKKIINNNTNLIYEGALEVDSYVKAVFEKESDTLIHWELAKILEVKPTENITLKKREKKNEFSYDYYVHFINLNRRHDKWLSRNEIELDSDFVKVELQKGHDKSFVEHNEHGGMDKASLQAHEEATKVKTISEIEFGKYKAECWYFSPYPEGYHEKILFICEFCLNFYVDKYDLTKHSLICPLKHPPGNEIYRDDKISMFEVDGQKEVIYCENLCYLGKLFLDHKTLAYDVKPFLFYILCEYDKYGYHFVGYFSKEKESQQEYNVACILSMPFHQRKGYGKFLIDFSYLLSKKEGKIGSPEEPLSDLGFLTYFSYWTQTIIKVLKQTNDSSINIEKISSLTSIRPVDITKVLEDLTLIRHVNNQNVIIADEKILDELYIKAGQPGHPLFPEKLIWTPYKLLYEFK